MLCRSPMPLSQTIATGVKYAIVCLRIRILGVVTLDRMKNVAVRILAVSVMWLVYVVLVIVPFAEKHGFFAEAFSPPADKTLPYFLMTTPVYLAYVIYTGINFSKVTSLRCLVYPGLVFNLYTGAFVCLMVMGGTVLWLMVLTFIFFVVAMAISLSIGLFKDSQSREQKKTDASPCHNCGRSQPAIARYCTNCGISIVHAQPLDKDSFK